MQIRLFSRNNSPSQWLIAQALDNARHYPDTLHYVAYPNFLLRDEAFVIVKDILPPYEAEKIDNKFEFNNGSAVFFNSLDYVLNNFFEKKSEKDIYIYVDNIETVSTNTRHLRNKYMEYCGLKDIYISGGYTRKSSFNAYCDFSQFIEEYEFDSFVYSIMSIGWISEELSENKAVMVRDFKCDCPFKHQYCMRLGNMMACDEPCPRYADLFVIGCNQENGNDN